jgi:hypothetical protein
MDDPLLQRPSVGELIDRLTIDQIKLLQRPDAAPSLTADIDAIEHDLTWHLRQDNLRSDAPTLRRVIALAQINWHIWQSKERMQQADHDFFMKLAHQLNGLRNRLKNTFTLGAARHAASDLKSNTDVDGLAQWTVSVLDRWTAPTKSSPGEPPPLKTDFSIADLIDAMAIAQLKETLFTGPAVATATEQLLSLTHDLDRRLAALPAPSPARVIRLSACLSLLHAVIWMNKDRLQLEPDRYMELLNEAQDLNGLRNVCRNELLATFGELTPATKRAVFLERHPASRFHALRHSLENDRVSDTPLSAVTPADLTAVFGLEADGTGADAAFLESHDLRYRRLSDGERDRTLQQVFQTILNQQFWVSGKGQQVKWEDGWLENWRRFEDTHDLSALVPGFLRKRKLHRFQRAYIEAHDPDFEFHLIDLYRQKVFRRFFASTDSIYEFGCGSGQHLPALVNLFPGKHIGGADWAESSLRIIESLNRTFHWSLEGFRFNMFEPDPRVRLRPAAGLLTVGAMEQLGEDFQAFLDYVLAQAPAVVVHLETIHELYDPENLMDYLARAYDERRNYLRGYLTRLKSLEAEGRVEILEARRAYFGSLYHDGYSLVAWRPQSAAPNAVDEQRTALI